MPMKKTQHLVRGLLALGLLFSLAACETPDKDLQLADLSQDEHLYIQRLIVLERAKAIAFNDHTLGDVVLDSLSLAWGDSAQTLTAQMAPKEPLRSAAVHDLLARILAAEQDSLMAVPLRRRLAAPLPDPVPEQPEPVESTE